MHTAGRIAAAAFGRLRTLAPRRPARRVRAVRPGQRSLLPRARSRGGARRRGRAGARRPLPVNAGTPPPAPAARTAPVTAPGSRPSGPESRDDADHGIHSRQDRLPRSGPKRPPPARTATPALELPGGGTRTVGFAEASRGCKHLCRHCPIVPVYDGRFRVVPREVVLARHPATGRGRRRAQSRSATPDFFNGPTHGLRIVTAMHAEHPHPHVRRHHQDSSICFATGAYLPRRCATRGASSSPRRWKRSTTRSSPRLRKNHTTADFETAAGPDARGRDRPCPPPLSPSPPWTTLSGYRDLLERIAALGLVASVPPVQLSIRLLVPDGSRLLELARGSGISSAPSTGPSSAIRGAIPTRGWMRSSRGSPTSSRAVARRPGKRRSRTPGRSRTRALGAPRPGPSERPRRAESRATRSLGTAAPSRPASSSRVSEPRPPCPPPPRETGSGSDSGSGSPRRFSPTLRIDRWAMGGAPSSRPRSSAAAAVTGGKVHLNGQRTKPAKAVRSGDRLDIRRGERRWEVRRARDGGAARGPRERGENPLRGAPRERRAPGAGARGGAGAAPRGWSGPAHQARDRRRLRIDTPRTDPRRQAAPDAPARYRPGGRPERSRWPREEPARAFARGSRTPRSPPLERHDASRPPGTRSGPAGATNRAWPASSGRGGQPEPPQQDLSVVLQDHYAAILGRLARGPRSPPRRPGGPGPSNRRAPATRRARGTRTPDAIDSSPVKAGRIAAFVAGRASPSPRTPILARARQTVRRKYACCVSGRRICRPRRSCSVSRSRPTRGLGIAITRALLPVPSTAVAVSVTGTVLLGLLAFVLLSVRGLVERSLPDLCRLRGNGGGARGRLALPLVALLETNEPAGAASAAGVNPHHPAGSPSSSGAGW